MSYRIRAYQPRDRPRVAALLTRLWSPDRTLNERYLSWRYEDNPYLDPLIAVCESEGEIVAVRGAHGMRWRVGGSPVLMPCLGDTVVERRHEGRALVQRATRWLLAALTERGIRWVVNQSPGPLVEKLSLRTGWRKVAQWTVARACNTGRDAATGFERFDSNAAKGDESGGLRISAAPASAAELAELAARGGRGHVGHVRDEAYFSWRFQSPLAAYRWLYARGQGLEGYLVLGNVRGLPWRVRILDLQGTDGRVRSLLLERALRWGTFREVRIWWNRFPMQVSKVLGQHGFTSAPDDGQRNSTHLIAATRPSADDDFVINGVDVLNGANWDPQMIHSDAT